MELVLSSVSKHFGGVYAVENVSIVFRSGEVVGLIGPNGAGKTTLLNMISSVLQLDGGEIHLNGVAIQNQGPRKCAIAGIARPARFFDELRKLGFTPEEHALRDHRPPDRKEIETLRDLPLLMTSKDEVKCPRDVHADAWVLEMELQFPAGFVQTLHERLAELVENTDGVSS